MSTHSRTNNNKPVSTDPTCSPDRNDRRKGWVRRLNPLQPCPRRAHAPAPTPASTNAKVAVMKSPRTPTTRVLSSSGRLGASCSNASRNRNTRSAICITTKRIHQNSTLLRMEARASAHRCIMMRSPVDRHAPAHPPSGRSNRTAPPSDGPVAPSRREARDRPAGDRSDRPTHRHPAAGR